MLRVNGEASLSDFRSFCFTVGVQIKISQVCVNIRVSRIQLKRFIQAFFSFCVLFQKQKSPPTQCMFHQLLNQVDSVAGFYRRWIAAFDKHPMLRNNDQHHNSILLVSQFLPPQTARFSVFYSNQGKPCTIAAILGIALACLQKPELIAGSLKRLKQGLQISFFSFQSYFDSPSANHIVKMVSVAKW